MELDEEEQQQEGQPFRYGWIRTAKGWRLATQAESRKAALLGIPVHWLGPLRRIERLNPFGISISFHLADYSKRATMILQAGTVIICTKRHRIGTLVRDVTNEPILPKLFNFESGQERVAGEEMVCAECGNPYFLNGNLYTEDGWKPNTPYIEPVKPRSMRR